MSKATICDRCRTILKCNPSAKIEIDFGYNGIAHYDLCEKCKFDLINFIRGIDNDQR